MKTVIFHFEQHVGNGKQYDYNPEINPSVDWQIDGSERDHNLQKCIGRRNNYIMWHARQMGCKVNGLPQGVYNRQQNR
ncbi:hypothetical protein [Bacteroides clarus]|uniref:hypothetical protein n=1 Tax=Bacteroides clarus TaxID=626929 RepID=UPI003FEEBA32